MSNLSLEQATAKNGQAVGMPKPRQEIPRWDQELRAAKNSGKFVKFQLATEAFFTDEECVVIGMVIETDKTGIKIIEQGSERSFWLSKSLIVGTEILS